ncbi:MAG: sialic acid TRAP transporter substrate-binding protein SiaP [Rhizobiales bacterium]|nr:sialic acid TRAP transporter substrate-binding protein SiaP [Hyphomicrobiales bacterium]NRB15601.1 sialic acid TRAP transporter substrate-binding protein SiaP [Hyphomicrobiales bacterium]
MKLSTKSKILTIAGAMLAMSMGVNGANAVEWKLGHVLPPSHPSNLALEAAAKEIAERTDNRIEIKVFPAGQIGGAKEVLTGMTIGTHQMAFDGAGILSQWNKSLGVFEAPFLSKDFNHLERLADSAKGQELFEQLRADHGLRVLDIWYYGTRHITSNKSAVSEISDLAGLKIRVPEVALSLEFAKALGMQPTPMSFSELYLAMQTGIVDGQENPLPTIDAAKFYEVQKHLVLSGHLVQFVAPIVSEDAWNAASEADRAVVLEVMTAQGAIYNQSIIDLEASLVEILEGKGMQVSRPNKADLADAMQDVYKQFEDTWGAGVYSALAEIE